MKKEDKKVQVAAQRWSVILRGRCEGSRCNHKKLWKGGQLVIVGDKRGKGQGRIDSFTAPPTAR